MEEVTSERLQIAYVGPALEQGRMPMLALGVGLRGQALLFQRVSDILYGDSVTIRVEIDPSFENGSLVVPVHVLTDALTAAENLLTSKAVTALANLLAILGFGGLNALTLYEIFKRRKGRPIEKPSDIPQNRELNTSHENLSKAYNDPEVQIQLRKTIEPLRRDGIEEFQTRRDGQIIQRVSKGDLHDADLAEVDSLTKDEEIDLGIEKAAWRRNLAWHLNDGRTSFDARIEDEAFWKRVQQGEAFADGDRMRVHLRTVARRTHGGILKLERTIPTVIDVEHVRHRQPDLFKDETPS
jgi:hypothetical protein